jgi:hemoglobin
MPDITSRNDIEKIMSAFYDKLLKDDAINYIFTDIARIDLEKHLPHIVDFWEQNILNTGNYKNNVLKIHLDLNEKIRLNATHFTTWLAHFNQTVDDYFSGEKAETMKTRALSIATVMQIKLQKSR